MPDVPTLPIWSYGDRITSAKLQQTVTAVDFLLNRPYCKVTSTVAQSLPDNATTALEWDSALSDLLGMWDVSNPTRITAVYPGKYSVFPIVEFAADADGTRAISLRINGTDVDGSVSRSATDAALEGLTVPNVVALDVGDYLEVMATVTGAGNPVFTGLTGFDPKCAVLWERV